MMFLHILYNKGRIGPAEAERIGQERVEMDFARLRQDIDAGGIFVRMFEIDIPGDKSILHHQHRID